MCNEEAQEHVAIQKRKGLSNVKFIGNLFLRGLLATRVVQQILVGLLGDTENVIEDHKVELACALLQTVGSSLEASGSFANVAGRLLCLKTACGPNGKPALSKRLQFLIQDVLDNHESGWTKWPQKEKTQKRGDVRNMK